MKTPFNSSIFRVVCCFNKLNGNTVDREDYFGQDLYNERYTVEPTNAWMDSFRSVLNRFDTTIESWKGFNYLAFLVIAIKKLRKENYKSQNVFILKKHP